MIVVMMVKMRRDSAADGESGDGDEGRDDGDVVAMMIRNDDDVGDDDDAGDDGDNDNDW